MKKWIPLLILSIGILTPVLSTALFFLWQPNQAFNRGDILSPTPIVSSWRLADGSSFSPTQWRGQWVLLQSAPGQCDSDCQRRLCRMRQLRLMLPGYYLRLHRAWLVTEGVPLTTLRQRTDCGEQIEPLLIERAQTVDTVENVQILFGNRESLPSISHLSNDSYIYLVDPTGVWAMRFSPDLTLREMQKDIAHLLKVSKGQKFFRNL